MPQTGGNEDLRKDASSTSATKNSRKRRRFFSRHGRGKATDQSVRELKAEYLEILQSRWVIDEEDDSQETIFLSSEPQPLKVSKNPGNNKTEKPNRFGELISEKTSSVQASHEKIQRKKKMDDLAYVDELKSAEASIRWIHFQRDPKSMAFEHFEEVVDSIPDLYDHERDIASKCLGEVKHTRKNFARGGSFYFEPIHHLSSQVIGRSIVEKSSVKASFLSCPVFALFSGERQKGKSEVKALGKPRSSTLSLLLHPLQYFSSLLHTRVRDRSALNDSIDESFNEHPIRSLMQYSDILAKDNNRDYQQVIRKPGTQFVDTDTFIHIPEIWALTINMYTLVTCAPFSLEDLCSDGIKLENLEINPTNVVVNYTDLHGSLHDFQCRTWFGLLAFVSKIEVDIDDLKTSLNDPLSDYKLIDSSFRTVDRAKWLELATKFTFVNLRLVKTMEDSPLTLAFAERKFHACMYATWRLLSLHLRVTSLRKEIGRVRKKGAEYDKITRLKSRINNLRDTYYDINRSRNFNRFLLYAARCYILDPHSHQRFLRQKENSRFRGVTAAYDISKKIQVGPDSEQVVIKREEGLPLLQKPQTSSVPSIKVQTPSAIEAKPVEVKEVQFAKVGEESQETPKIKISTPSSITSIPAIQFGSQTKNVTRSNTYDSTFHSHLTAQGVPQAMNSRNVSALRKENFPSFVMLHDSIDQPLDPNLGSHQPTADPLAPSIVDPYSTGSSNRKPNHLLHLTPMASTSLEQRFHYNSQFPVLRRYSSAGDVNLAPAEILAAPPQRFPLNTGAVFVGQAHDTQTMALKRSRSFNHLSATSNDQESNRATEAPDVKKDSLGENVVTLQIQAEKRTATELEDLVPFLEWREHFYSQGVARDISPKDGNVRSKIPSLPSSPVLNLSESQHEEDALSAEKTAEVLSEIHQAILSQKFLELDTLKVNKPQDREALMSHEAILKLVRDTYDKTTSKKIADISMGFKVGFDGNKVSSNSSEAPEIDMEAEEFLETKKQLFLRAYGLLACFVYPHREREPACQKFWGVIYTICGLNLRGAKPLIYPLKHEIEWIRYASRELEKIERRCRELLMDVRPETDTYDSGRENLLPKPLSMLLRDISIFLVCTRLAVSDLRMKPEIVNTAREIINVDLLVSDGALQRIAERAEFSPDQLGEESIRTADTLLSLLLENAFSFSDFGRDELAESGNAKFDIVELYDDHTAFCVDRAKNEASAVVYEDVRLLREELDTVNLVLKHQYDLFRRILKERESPLQKLDERVNHRIGAYLDEMNRHFVMLSEYARKAQLQTRNSIEVRAENNNKAIYVFTAVTVVFLPLSFVAGLMGMNTSDIRNESDTEWVFWAVAIPFTILVLLVCVYVASYFRYRRLLRNIFYLPLLFCRRRRQDRRSGNSYKEYDA